jgi:sphingomyelin phosphodiesterase acid-like 3
MLEFWQTMEHSPDFILFGGDATAHSTGFNRSQIQSVFRKIVEGMAAVYPSVPIVVTLGNNDFVPNYGNFVNDPLDFQSLSEVLTPFFSDDQRSTFLKGGYYSSDFPSRKLRLLLLNTCMYSTVRGYSTPDPYDQFQWIIDSATSAHIKGYTVGIAMHIPPGVSYIDLTQGWPDQYIERFDQVCKESNILFTLAGHTHYDMLMPVNATDGKSKGYSLSSPSISPQHSNNPGFRLIDYDETGIRNIRQYSLTF